VKIFRDQKKVHSGEPNSITAKLLPMKYILSLKNATSFYAEVAALSFGP
jgi:hypothetical protein